MEKILLMPEESAVLPTGSAWISENVPAFKSMRAEPELLDIACFHRTPHGFNCFRDILKKAVDHTRNELRITDL